MADVVTPIVFEEGLLALLALGVVTGQLTVICVWGTMVRGTFWIRLPWTLLMLMLSWCALAWGLKIQSGRADTDEMLGVGVLWSFGFVTSYVPLKIAALSFRWQIVRDSPDRQNAERKSNYAIRDIMIGTLLLAMSMAIGRAVLPDDEISVVGALRASGLDELDFQLAITLYGIVSLLVKLPCVWISLGERADRIPSRIGAWSCYCLLLAIGEFLFLIAVFGSPADGRTMELLAGMILCHLLMGAIILGVCLALRGLGYRLERSLSKRAEDPPTADHS